MVGGVAGLSDWFGWVRFMFWFERERPRLLWPRAVALVVLV